MRISDWSSDVCSSDLVIAASGVDFRTGGAKAYYVPSADYVQVPPQPAFYEQINFYRTALHELCHASGHPSRLNRNLLNTFGSKDYADRKHVVWGKTVSASVDLDGLRFMKKKKKIKLKEIT